MAPPLPVETLPFYLSDRWPLLLAPVALGLLLSAKRTDEPWRWSIDPFLALGLGGVLAALSFTWLSPVVLTSESNASDFSEYCEAVVNMMGLSQGGESINRSRVPAWLIAQLATPLGIVDGMLAGALAGLVLVGASLYLWGRCAHSRLAGIAAALLAGAFTPLALLSRTVTFYPLVTGAFALAGAGALVMARFGHPLAFAFGGFSAGLALLFDLRGLFWALPVIGIGLLLALRRPWGLVPIRWLALLLPMWWSHYVGGWAYLPTTSPLERQADVQRFALEMGYTYSKIAVMPKPTTQFIWGRTDLREVPETLRYLSHFSKLEFQLPGDIENARAAAGSRMGPWWKPLGVGAVIALYGLRRHPYRLLALIAACLPFLSSLRGAVTVQAAEWRFLGNALPFAPAVLGIAFATLAVSPWGTRRTHWLPLLGGAALLALVTGRPQSWLSPFAPWRTDFIKGTSQMDIYLLAARDVNAQASRDIRPFCAAAVKQDLADGEPVLYDLTNVVSVKEQRKKRRP